MNQDCATRPAGDDRAFAVALCRSLIYETLSIGFQPAGTGTVAQLNSGRLTGLCDIAGMLDDLRGGTLREAATVLLQRHAEMAGRPGGEPSIASLQTAHSDLFGHTARSRVPAYETEYGDDLLLQRPHELSDIGGFLRAFGLQTDPRSHERVDHIACELEFLAFLARKEAHAIETGDATMLAETRRAETMFLQDHLGRFVPSFATRLQREDPSGFYGALAGLCRLLLLDDCRALAVDPGAESLRMRLPIDDGAPIACGTGDCAPGAAGESADLAAVCGACGPAGPGPDEEDCGPTGKTP